MANFPQLLTPITSGGLQSTGLQQKPIDLNPIIDGLQKERMAAAAKPKASKNAGKDDLKIRGLPGEVMTAWQTQQKSKAIMGGLLDTFGELALDLPQYRQAANATDQIHSPHADEIRYEREKQYGVWQDKLMTRDSYGVMPNDLYNLNTAMKGTLKKQQQQAEEIKYSPDGNYSKDVWDIHTQHDKHAQEWLNEYFEPAAKAFRSDASAKVFKHQLAGDDVAGIMTSKHSWSANEKALKTAYLGALEQAGFDISEDDKGRPIIGSWRPSNPSSAIQGGMMQEMLKHLNAENNPQFKNKDGSFNFEKFAEVATPIVRQRINNAYERRLSVDKDESKSFQKPSDWELQQYGEATRLLSDTALPPINVDQTIAVQENFFSKDNLTNALGKEQALNLLGGMMAGQGFDLKAWATTGEDKLKDFVNNGVLQRAIVDGKEVYGFTPEAANNLNEMSTKAARQGDIATSNMAQTMKESLEMQKNARINPDATGGVFNNASISTRNLFSLQEKISKDIAVADDASTALDGKVIMVAGHPLSGFMFKGLGLNAKVASISAATATMPNVKGANFIQGQPIYSSVDDKQPSATTGYAEWDEKSQRYIASPKRIQGDDSGSLQYMSPDSPEYQYAKQRGQLSTEDPRLIKESTHSLSTGATLKGSLTPEEEKKLARIKIPETVYIPDIKNKASYQTEKEIVEKLYRDKRLSVRTGLDKEVGFKEMEKELRNAGLNDEQIATAKKMGYDPDVVGQIMFVAKSGNPKNYPNKRIATMTSLYDLETREFSSSSAGRKIVNTKTGAGGETTTEVLYELPIGMESTDHVIQDAAFMKDKNGRKKLINNLGLSQDGNSRNGSTVFNTNAENTAVKGQLKGNGVNLPSGWNNQKTYNTGAPR